MIKYWLYFAILVAFSGCGKTSSSGHYGGKDSSANVTINEAHGLVNYNLFIDNSASMGGYVINNTVENESKFKSVLSSLASDIEVRLGSKPTISFITDKPYLQTLSETSSSFIHSLTLQKLKQNRRVTDTQIDSIINICMNGLDSNINILTSDCIFSKKDAKKNVIDPQKAKDDLKVFVAKKLTNTNIATIVLKYNSDFSGTYYSESRNDTGILLNQKTINRPFYVLIFGKSDNILPMLSKINFHYPGFEASYCLAPNKGGVKIDAAVTSENKTGNFSFQKPASSMVIYDASPNNNGIFQFSINADLSKVSVERNFLLQPSNYSVNDNFKVVAVIPITGQSDYTHTLTVMTNNLQQSHNLKVGLKYEPPDWVAKTGSTIDNNPIDTVQQHQTYGFQYLMQGIAQGYIAKNDSMQFSIPVTISKGNVNGATNASSFPWWILIAVAGVVGIIIWLKNKS